MSRHWPIDSQTEVWELAAPRQFRRRTIELDPLPDGWARIKFLYCGVCGSDMSQYEGSRSGQYPRSLGHEFVAIVESVADPVEGIDVGDLVVSDLNYRCHHCYQCSAGRSHLCLVGQSGRFTNRAFSERANIDATYLWPIRNQSLHPQLALIEPLSCVLHAVEWAALTPTDTILILGAGSLGLCMSLAIVDRKLMNGTQFWDPIYPRLDALTRAAGITAAASTPPSKTYEVVFDLTGTRDGLMLACDAVRPGGRLCSMSHLDNVQDTGFLLSKLTRNDVAFKMSYLNGPKESLGKAAEIVAKHWNSTYDATLSIHSAASLSDVFAARRDSPANKSVIDLRTFGKSP